MTAATTKRRVRRPMVTEWNVCVSDATRRHNGVCTFGKHMMFGDMRADMVLRLAIDMAEDSNNDDDHAADLAADVALVKPLIDAEILPDYVGQWGHRLAVPMTAEQAHALQRLGRDADDYFAACDYAGMPDEEDSKLAHLNAWSLGECITDSCRATEVFRDGTWHPLWDGTDPADFPEPTPTQTARNGR